MAAKIIGCIVLAVVVIFAIYKVIDLVLVIITNRKKKKLQEALKAEQNAVDTGGGTSPVDGEKSSIE